MLLFGVMTKEFYVRGSAQCVPVQSLEAQEDAKVLQGSSNEMVYPHRDQNCLYRQEFQKSASFHQYSVLKMSKQSVKCLKRGMCFQHR